MGQSMKHFLFLSFFLFLISCNNEPTSESSVSTQVIINSTQLELVASIDATINDIDDIRIDPHQCESVEFTKDEVGFYNYRFQWNITQADLGIKADFSKHNYHVISETKDKLGNLSYAISSDDKKDPACP